ncbi:MAG: hypothetical protein WC607_00495 [Candidatus Micrarchaeia archaeon]
MFEVYFDAEAMAAAVREFEAAAGRGREGIGFFLGKVYSWQGGLFVRATEFVTGESDATAVSVRFAEGAFAGIAGARGDDLIAIWAHSHPDYGCFMSERDLETHENYFANDYNYALVVDPVRREKKLFKVRDGKCLEASFAVVEKK